MLVIEYNFNLLHIIHHASQRKIISGAFFFSNRLLCGVHYFLQDLSAPKSLKVLASEGCLSQIHMHGLGT